MASRLYMWWNNQVTHSQKGTAHQKTSFDIILHILTYFITLKMLSFLHQINSKLHCYSQVENA